MAIKIELVDGTVLVNDSRYGINLDTADEIEECLSYTGGYWWKGADGRRHLFHDDVKRVYEEDE